MTDSPDKPRRVHHGDVLGRRSPAHGVPTDFADTPAPITGVISDPYRLAAARAEQLPETRLAKLEPKVDDHAKRIGVLEVTVAGVGGKVDGLGGKVDTLSMFVGALNTTLTQRQQVDVAAQVEAAKIPNLKRERWNLVLKLSVVALPGLGWLAHWLVTR